MNETSKISKALEDAISEALIKAVQNLSIEVDEKELWKRLRDSKEQYQRGYEDREREIVRCRDCIYYNPKPDIPADYCNSIHWSRGLNWYCADGERKKGR